MKKLSKDERIGAAALAVVALVVCGGAFFAKRMGKKEHASPEIIKSIILASEEEGESEALSEENFEAPKAPHTETNASGHKERMGEDKKKEGKRNKKAKKKEGEAKKAASPPRDHLAEPI
ncbi:MAG: hypothetical protein K2M53_03945 [Muribaculaceae bacterium]|nr:hypothetical protein [Muribaculaceae bacterium]